MMNLIAPDDDAPPVWWRRAVVFPLVFIPWLVLYEWVVYRGPMPRAFATYLPGEVNWPVWQWAELLYASPYLLVTLAPLVAPTNRVLRRFVIAGLISAAVVFLCFLLVPAIAPPRPFAPSGVLGRMMLVERSLDRNNGTAAFPSFHVVWAFLGAAVFASRQQLTARGKMVAGMWWVWAAAVAGSCVMTGMHSLADVMAGFGVFVVTYFGVARAERAVGAQSLSQSEPSRLLEGSPLTLPLPSRGEE